VGADHVDRAQRIELSVVLGLVDLAGDPQGGPEASAHNAEPLPVEVDDLAVEEPDPGADVRPEQVGEVDVAVGHEGVVGKGLEHPLVLGPGQSDEALPHLEVVGRAAPHDVPGLVEAPPGPETGRFGHRPPPEDIDQDPLHGVVVEDVDQIAQHEEGVASRGRLGQVVGGAVEIGDHVDAHGPFLAGGTAQLNPGQPTRPPVRKPTTTSTTMLSRIKPAPPYRRILGLRIGGSSRADRAASIAETK
jgi:hypothetical protein